MKKEIRFSPEYFVSFVNTDEAATIIQVPAGIVMGQVTSFEQYIDA